MALGHNNPVLAGVLAWKGLSKEFRVIAFDQYSFGANTRIEYCSGLESFTRAEECLNEWYNNFMAAIDHILPRKFYMYSMSGGTFPMGIWATKNADRVDKLLYDGPAGVFRGSPPPIREQRC